MELIPAIDLRDGQVVRLLQGDFDAETRYAVTPVDLAHRYRGRARDVCTSSISRPRDAARSATGSGCESSPPVVAEGPDRRRRAARRRTSRCSWMPAPSAWSSAASRSTRPRGSRHGSAASGGIASSPRSTCASARTATRGSRPTPGSGRRGCHSGARSRGCKARPEARALHRHRAGWSCSTGPNVPLYAECVRRFPKIAWQASGGVRDAVDLRALAATGVTAAISGKALLESRIPPEELTPFLPAA